MWPIQVYSQACCQSVSPVITDNSSYRTCKRYGNLKFMYFGERWFKNKRRLKYEVMIIIKRLKTIPENTFIYCIRVYLEY